MKFRFYIVDHEGNVSGTDDQRIANEAKHEELAVIDTDGGHDMSWSGTDSGNIKEQTVYVLTPHAR